MEPGPRGGPGSGLTHLEVALFHFERGDRDEGSRHLERARALEFEGPLPLASLAVVHAASGDEREARRLLEKIKAESARRYVSPVLPAMIHAALAEDDRAFALLDKACAAKDPALISIQVGESGPPPPRPGRAWPPCAPIHASTICCGGWAWTRGHPTRASRGAAQPISPFSRNVALSQ